MIREQMYAALGATNEAILRTTAQDDLFQRVCDAAVHEGGFKAAAAMLPEADDWLRTVAAAGYSIRARRVPSFAFRSTLRPNADRAWLEPRFGPARSHLPTTTVMIRNSGHGGRMIGSPTLAPQPLCRSCETARVSAYSCSGSRLQDH